jgi:hypothetical protein
VLRRGTLLAPLLVDEQVIVLARRLQAAGITSWAITATNNGDAPRRVTVLLPTDAPAGLYIDALGGASLQAQGGRLTLDLPAAFGTVLITR